VVVRLVSVRWSAASDVVADGANTFEALAVAILEFPVQMALAGRDRHAIS